MRWSASCSRSASTVPSSPTRPRRAIDRARLGSTTGEGAAAGAVLDERLRARRSRGARPTAAVPDTRPVRHGVLPLPGRRVREDGGAAAGGHQLHQRGRPHLRHALQLRLVRQRRSVLRHRQLAGGPGPADAGSPDGLPQHELPARPGARAVAADHRRVDHVRADAGQHAPARLQRRGRAVAALGVTGRAAHRRVHLPDALHVRHARRQPAGQPVRPGALRRLPRRGRQQHPHDGQDLPRGVPRRNDDPAGEDARVHDLRPWVVHHSDRRHPSDVHPRDVPAAGLQLRPRR